MAYLSIRFKLVTFISIVSLQSVLSETWDTLYRDDFNGGVGTLPGGWNFDIGHHAPGGPVNWGTSEIEYDTEDPDNVSLDGRGNLRITPRRDSNGQWTSARIETQREDFRPPPGGKMAMEARIRLPDVRGDAALGYWPAFWALGSPIRHGKVWPAVGEIDVMENVNSLDQTWGTLHCGVSVGGACNEPTGLSRNRSCPGRSCDSGFHVYRVEWDESTNPKEMRWYVDGQQYNTVTATQLDSATWDNMTNHPGYFIILDVAMGGVFPDRLAGKQTPTEATKPDHSMVIDYVAVYTRK